MDNYFDFGPQGFVDNSVKCHIQDSRMRIVADFKARNQICQNCVDFWRQKYSSNMYGFQGDPDLYDDCPICHSSNANQFDQNGDVVCFDCASISMIHTLPNNGQCWECECAPITFVHCGQKSGHDHVGILMNCPKTSRFSTVSLCEPCKKKTSQKP